MAVVNLAHVSVLTAIALRNAKIVNRRGKFCPQPVNLRFPIHYLAQVVHGTAGRRILC